MRKLLYIAFSFTLMFAGIQGVHAQTKDTAKKAAPKESDELIYYTEPMPEFPGGNEAMKKWIKAQVQYPKEALAKGVKGAVFVEVNVMKDGSLSSISVVFGIGSGCDEEALRIAKAMPKWKPGLKNGKPVRVLMRFPVMFELPGQEMKTNGGGQMQQQGPRAPQGPRPNSQPQTK